MLYIVPTPIGNLKDITLRALEVLKNVDFILAEDTRTSSKLLNHYGIKTKMVAYHMYNEHKSTNNFITQLKEGKSIALITDAGTPGISDPGFFIIRECKKNNIEVDCLPGATAFIPALIMSGIPCNEFTFIGFLPLKKGRKSILEKLKQEKRTFILYESPYKLLKTINDLSLFFGEETEIFFARELTKIYQETKKLSLKEAKIHFSKKEPKGEFVLIINIS